MSVAAEAASRQERGWAMQNVQHKGRLLHAEPKAAEPSLTALALRILAALWRLGCRQASRVLSVGDCSVH